MVRRGLVIALSQIIVTSRYLKSGTQKSKNKRRNYTKYIATRETVEVRDQNTIDRNNAATKNQKELIDDLLIDFPEAKRYLEYEDYTANPTVENASELIRTIIERNADVIGNRQNFVGYMAMRPGVQKRGSHGLFNEKDEPIILDRVANEIANHKGNVWSHVVSLRREDAIRLGYDNSEVWRDLVKRHISDIAKAQRIPLCNLKWYAAFHDTTHHPHIHLLVYSMNPKQGFLTAKGIDQIRSAFANDIFHDDLQSIYQEQTLSRDELKAVSKTEFENIIRKIQQSSFDNPQLENLIQKLYSQLQNVRGKKMYGYLPPEVKETVNNIFSELAKDENVRQLYEKWCDLERLKYKTYTQKEKDLPVLTDNKVFQPVRNMIIRTVLDMNNPIVDVSVEETEPTVNEIDNSNMDTPPQLDESEQSENNKVIFSDNDNFTAEDFIWSDKNTVTVDVDDTLKSKYYLKWSTSYKEACKIIYDKQSKSEDFQKAEQLLLSESQAGNVLAIHDLGKLYSTEKLGSKDEEKSFAYYKEALQGFMEAEPDSDFMFPYEPKYEGQIMKPVDMRSYVWYRIGKIYCYGLESQQNYGKAFEWFLKSATEGNKFAQYSIANLYYYGNGVEKDLSQAFLWYRKSASQGQPYASYSIAQMYGKGEYVNQSEETAQRYYKDALSGFLELESKDQADDNLYYKLGAMFKKGLGTDIDMNKAIDYFKRSADAEMNNRNGLYECGKALLLGEHISKNKEKAVQLLEKAINLKNINAKRFLGLEYISGEHLEQNIEKGLDMLSECADSGDVIACYKLGKIDFKGEIVLQDLDKAEKYLLLAEDNEFTQYALGKLYLQEEKYDIQKAVDYFEKSADENIWSSYQIGRLYLFGSDGLEKDKEKAIEWLTKSANDGNEYAQNMLQQTEDFENAVLANTILSLFVKLSRCIEDDYTQKYKAVRRTVDSRLRRMIHRKKQSLGMKEDITQNFY